MAEKYLTLPVMLTVVVLIGLINEKTFGHSMVIICSIIMSSFLVVIANLIGRGTVIAVYVICLIWLLNCFWSFFLAVFA